MMDILIVGAGSIGGYLAQTLSGEGHNIIVIDKNLRALEKLQQTADVATRWGSGCDWKLLEELTDPIPHLFIALSDDDEVNLVSCTIAKNLGIPKTVARVHNEAYLNRSRLDFNRLFFVDHIIGTELILAHDILKCILSRDGHSIENFAHGAVQLRTMVVPENWPKANQRLTELNLHDNLLVGLIQRKINTTKETLIFPRGNDVLLPNDKVTWIGERETMAELPKFFGYSERHISSVTIVGGSDISLHITRLLEESDIHVKIIEQNEQRCQFLAHALPNATILNQDGTDLNFLISERVDLADVFVACTSSNETNILAAALGKQAGCRHVITLVTDESYAPLLKSMGIVYTLSERISISNKIHAIIQADSVISVASLYENKAKIIELKVSTNSEIVGLPISDLAAHLPQHFLIALIENRGLITIAKGNKILFPGDTVIVICDPKHIPEIKKIF